MKRKKYLYIGILFLLSGIVLRTMGMWGIFPYFIIGIGVVFKLSYMGILLKQKKYKPGYELLILYLGLSVFFSGMFLKNNQVWEYASVLMYLGIMLKLAFLVLFIRKVRAKLVPVRDKARL